MGLVKFALKFRITFCVLAFLILLSGIGASVVANKDVLPNVDIPVVVVVWTYTGLDPTDMASRVTTYSEFALSNNVNGIKRMESTTLQGTTIERIYFQEDVTIDLAVTQVVAATNSIRGVMPPGIQPPVIMRFAASSVPVVQLALTSASEPLSQVYDYAQYRIRQTLTQVPGSTLPSPYGGAPREIMVDLDLNALAGYGLTPIDVTNAISGQNPIEPSGLAKIGDTQYPIKLNASPQAVSEFNEIPIKVVHGSPVLIRDVAYVRDGSPPQQNVVRSNRQSAVLETVLKNGTASTLSVVNNVKNFLPQIRAAAPKDMKITPLFDQSVFVSSAIEDVVREALIAAALTGGMILLFLGSWRSTLVVLVSIPLSILTSLVALTALGETINIMTLGGLALAVGILVDDATVAIENSYRLMEEGRPFREAVVEGGAGIAKPALISTLAICSAFVSVFFLTDTPKYLFTPQGLAVVFAMLASYGLSRTLVPILIDVLVAKEYADRHPDQAQDQAQKDGAEHERAEEPQGSRFGRWLRSFWPRRRCSSEAAGKPGFFQRFQLGFDRAFGRFRAHYLVLVHAAIDRPVVTLAAAALILLIGGGLMFVIGQDYFPQISSSTMILHVRTRPGMRIETATQKFSAIEDAIHAIIPPRDLDVVLDNIGLPASNYNLAFNDGSFVAYNDGQILISLKPSHASTADYMRQLRRDLNERFPDCIFYFQPADIITQILDFGSITPIDVQVNGRHPDKDLEVAQSILRRLKGARGVVDAHIHQIPDAPLFQANVDRRLALELGLTEQQIASGLNISLAGSYQTAPSFWSDPSSGIPYQVWVQTPEYRNDSLTALRNTPLYVLPAGDNPGALGLLSSVAQLTRRSEPTVISHVNAQPTYDVFASVQDSDLGSVRRQIDAIVADEQKKLEPPDKIFVRGQIEDMDSAFFHIEIGLGIALVAVYLLMAVNFQSWGDPFVVLAALPLAFCGIAGSLFVTGTTLSIPSLFGAIMSVGVASANSILLVQFAREERERSGCGAREAAIKAGATRLRPVLMTAGAMFVGLLPMAIGLGEGSEQNAALARAVLGGVAVGTCSTLVFVPFLYSYLRRGTFQPVRDYL
ncbi:MAG TPA: efflux RND transporter permease subunit [Roseiarcus sp.]|jgi:multidrug efflux pump subunit AcrB